MTVGGGIAELNLPQSLIQPTCFVILNEALLLNFIVNEAESEMTILLIISRSLILIFLVFYIYFFTQRKKHNVELQMWLTIIVGMIAGLSDKLIGINQGRYTWSSVQLSLLFYLALIIYSFWKLTIELKKRRQG